MKRTMKRMIALMLAFAMSAGLFAACSAENTVSDDGKISVVATIFPEYDWASNIIGDLKNNYDLTLLLDNGVDLLPLAPMAASVEGLQRIADVPIYFADALVRRAGSLQQTRDAAEPVARIHPETLDQLVVSPGARV